MAITHPAGIVRTRTSIPVRKIELHDLWWALAQGWKDFMVLRGDLVFIGFVYPVVVLSAVLLAMQATILPLLFPLAAGSILLGPAAASGYYELARRRELGLDVRWRHFLDVMHGPATPSLIAMTGVVAFIFVLWIGAAQLLYAATLGPELPVSMQALLEMVFNTPQGMTMLIVGNLIGLGFAILTLAISAVSFPMLVDRRVGWWVAMHTSLRVAWKNPVTIAVWGLVVVALLVLGSLPALVGLAVVLPVLGYATWHLYTRAVSNF